MPEETFDFEVGQKITAPHPYKEGEEVTAFIVKNIDKAGRPTEVACGYFQGSVALSKVFQHIGATSAYFASEHNRDLGNPGVSHVISLSYGHRPTSPYFEGERGNGDGPDSTL